MALDFTRLSDVTLVEEATETANVLIEESGEIKRVPKTEVGGGKLEYDAVFEVIMGTDSDDGITYISGDYQTIYDKIMVEKEEPKIKVICKVKDYGTWHSVNSTNVTVLVNEEDNNSVRIVMSGINGYGVSGAYYIHWSSDGELNGLYK